MGKVHTLSSGRTAATLLGILVLAGAAAAQASQYLYVTDYGKDSVFRYNAASGAFVDVFVAAGSGGLDGPEDLAFGPDGHLYVAGLSNGAVTKYDGETGALLGTFIPAGSGGLGAPFRVLFAPDGRFYVSDVNGDSVLRYDAVTGDFIDAFVPSGSAGLTDPEGLAFGADGNLYVSSAATSEVLKFDGITGAFIAPFVTAGSGGLNHPHCGIFGPDGNFYVASYGTHAVKRYDSTGAPLGDFVPTNGGGLASPVGLAFSLTGDLYVGSPGSASVKRYDGVTGAFKSSVSEPVSTLPLFVAFRYPGFSAGCSFRNGSGVNQTGYACETAPVVGSPWISRIDGTPATTAFGLAFSATPAQITLGSGGEALIGVVPAPLLYFSATAVNQFDVPNLPILVSLVVYTQGFRVDLVGPTSKIVPLNAQDLTLGY